MDFHDYVRSLGLDPAALSAEQSDALEAAWRAAGKAKDQQKKAADPVKKEELDDVVAAAEAETARRAGIVAKIKEYLGRAPDRIKDLEAVGRMALDGKWTVQETEYALLKQCYQNGPAAFSPSQQQGQQVSQAVLEAAVCRAAGLGRESVERAYSDQVLSAADKHFRGGCGLVRLLTFCANANGHKDAHASNPRNLLRAAFAGGEGSGPQASIGFGPSTYDLSGILSNVANKFIVDSFNAVESVWRQIAATRPVNDFKQISSYALTGDLTYKLVGPGGEVKHGTLGETSYTNQADLYALMLGIDYRDLRNDDLGAFSKLSRRLGRGGALTINDVFWAAFLAGQGTFWSAANQNYLASTDYAFALDKLANAATAWMLRTDPDGKPMGDTARYLLVPPGLNIPARTFMNSTQITEDSGNGSTNVLAGMWTVLASTYLANSNISGYSTTNYFLVADPADLPVIEMAFLDGQEVPTIEMAEPDLSRMGIMIRGSHGFGANHQEPRGAIKFKQTAD